MDMNHEHKKLYRSRNNRIIGGVCAGFAKYFNVDPTWARIVFILFVILGGITCIIYLILWLIIPEEKSMS